MVEGLDLLSTLISSRGRLLRPHLLGEDVEPELLDILPVRQRMFLTLHYLETQPLKVHEIAALFKVTKGYVSQEINKGKITLATHNKKQRTGVQIQEASRYSY